MRDVHRHFPGYQWVTALRPLCLRCFLGIGLMAGMLLPTKADASTQCFLGVEDAQKQDGAAEPYIRLVRLAHCPHPVKHHRRVRKRSKVRPLAVTDSGPPVVPSALEPRYGALTPGKARMKTCLDQYRANKIAGKNGGMVWTRKGGGYYSSCNARLKGH
jgi:hypothetical protein